MEEAELNNNLVTRTLSELQTDEESSDLTPPRITGSAAKAARTLKFEERENLTPKTTDHPKKRWKVQNPDVVITDVTCSNLTVTFSECSTKDGFFSD